MGRPLYFLE
jgi:hypothetical protein